MKSLLFILLLMGANPLLTAQCSDNAIRDELGALTAALTEAGYATTYLTRCGTLQDGVSRIHDVQVYGGVRYNLLAVTDQNCAGAKVEVIDRKGNVLAQHDPRSQRQTLSFTPPNSRNVRVKVTLADCKPGRCYYGLRLQAE
ncbi:hypothetical protein LEM8419_03193 [Neolewinella maritima]|uniref:Uncharacterized protein n=1 Tax=Neolewinella maritima TaxID=1383882 RepID=A0ABN8FAI3_9BACT|nr:hypothetical protein [Neolewinella maritima]CAH1002274.1 hypothetical protein LEM8419_03193 [Neolewinella maritima]